MEHVFICRGKDAFAKGHPADDGRGFVVLKGSRITSGVAPSFVSSLNFRSYYQKRLALIADGTIENGVFTADYRFRSASAASSVVLGKPSNGRKDWRPALED